MRLKMVFLGLAAVAVFAVGCGGGGGDSTTGGTGSGSTTEGASTTVESGSTTGEESTSSEEGKSGEESKSSGPLTKAEFVKQGDAVCKKVPAGYQKSLQALEKEAKAAGKPKPSKAEENLKAAVPPLYTAVEELEALEPPSGEEQQAEAIVAALESAAKGLEANPTSELSGPKSPFAEFQKLTGEYGFKLCSQL
jgi:hypothetical protein